MLKVLAASACLGILGAAVVFQPPGTENCRLTIRLVDSQTRQPVKGIVRFSDETGAVHRPSELLSRGTGLKPEDAISQWSVIAKESVVVSVPQTKLTLAALSGIETERTEIPLDLTGRAEAEVSLPLVRFGNLREKQWASGNTHLHLMKLTREESDRYLTEIPQADDLDVLFVSYLERAIADRDYITNQYSRDDLAKLSAELRSKLGNGEEHRHNFTGQGEGYGHVMFLDLPQLVLPVSIGPGIMQMGTDGLPIQRGIEQARKSGATAVWCHNSWGYESIPNWVTGRLDAQNIFDGGTHGSYKDSFYRYLNAGLRVPFSTGTDWFVYDFSRVYVPVEVAVTPQSWLKSLKAGRGFITNGPLLELEVAGKAPGDRLDFPQARNVTIRVRGTGRIDFGKLELVRNGEVVRSQKSRKVGMHYEADAVFVVDVTGPGWFALRTPPPPVANDPQLQEKVPLNEFGQPLFSHTSPVYVRVNGRDLFDAGVARELLATIERNRTEIVRLAKFADETERVRVLAVHDEAIETLRRRIAEAR